MIKIFSNYNGKVQEITSFCKSISLSGSIKEVSRKLELTLFYVLNDPYQLKIQLAPATQIWANLNNKEIFRGIVIDRSISSSDELHVTCFDYAYYLKRNKVTFNFLNVTAQEATKQILKEIGVEIGSIAYTNIKLRYLLAQKSAYDSIMELYTQVSKQTGKQYFIVMRNTKVNVIEMGATLTSRIIKPCRNVFVGDGNLLEFSYKDSMGNMINRVKIYDEKNNYLSKIDSTTDIKHYGILQDNYVKEKDKNATIVAKNMLHSIDREVTCKVLGCYDYLTGYAVNVQIPYISTLANAKMYIVSDTHTFDCVSGEFFTELTLSYINQMDIKNSDDTQKFDTKQEKEAKRAEKKKVRETKKAQKLKKKGQKKKTTKGKKGKKKKEHHTFEELLHMG